MKTQKVSAETREFSRGVARGLRRAGQLARKTARMHGTLHLYLKKWQGCGNQTLTGLDLCRTHGKSPHWHRFVGDDFRTCKGWQVTTSKKAVRQHGSFVFERTEGSDEAMGMESISAPTREPHAALRGYTCGQHQGLSKALSIPVPLDASTRPAPQAHELHLHCAVCSEPYRLA